jgi:hypothetical protein
MGTVCCSATEEEPQHFDGPNQYDTLAPSLRRRNSIKVKMLSFGQEGHDSTSSNSSSDEEPATKQTKSQRVQKIVKQNAHYLQDYDKINKEISRLMGETAVEEHLNTLDQFEILNRIQLVEITNYCEILLDALVKDTLFSNPEDSGITDEEALNVFIAGLKLQTRKFCQEMRGNRNKLKQLKKEMFTTSL